MTDLKERVKNLGLVFYRGTSNEDILITKWWMKLHENGDINKLIAKKFQTLAKFLSMFQDPNGLIYYKENDKLLLATWFFPFELSDDCIYLSAWTDESVRGSKKQAKMMATIYALIFEIKSVIIGVTKQKPLLPIHRKIGYDVLGCVPKIFDGEDGFIVVLKKNSFREGSLKPFLGG